MMTTRAEDWDEEQRRTLNGLREAYRAKHRRYIRLDGDEGFFLHCRSDRSGEGSDVTIDSYADYRNFIQLGFLLESKAGQGLIAHRILTWDSLPEPAIPTIQVSGSGHAIAIQAGNGNTFTGLVRADANGSSIQDAYQAAIDAMGTGLPESDHADTVELLEGAIAEGRQFPPRSTCVVALLAAASSRCVSSPSAQAAISALAAALGLTVSGQSNTAPN